MAAGIATGLLSHAVDTAAWAPPWIGQVLTPWLALAWLAGATTARPGRAGPLLGLATLAAVTAAYLLASGPRSGELWPVLAAVTLVAGPAYGWAGAAWRERGRWAGPGLALLGVALLVEGISLQLGERVAMERIGFAAEAAIGLVIIGAGIRRAR
ncbi:MAG TPA: DUF6518 family protein [Candidatus Limnocylindrales bacterium]|nr:DUF6518 family protein [Candidatus Limnocylindrales bacterium]